MNIHTAEQIVRDRAAARHHRAFLHHLVRSGDTPTSRTMTVRRAFNRAIGRVS